MAFFVPVIAAKMNNQKMMALLVAAMYFVGMAVLFVSNSPALIGLALVLTGLGAGSSTSLATVDITLRSRDGAVASSLAGMSQFIGYILAASGPALLGRVNDITGNWNLPIGILIAMIIVMTVVSYVAGEDRTIG